MAKAAGNAVNPASVSPASYALPVQINRSARHGRLNRRAKTGAS